MYRHMKKGTREKKKPGIRFQFVDSIVKTAELGEKINRGKE